jgi:mRNA interferase RelE/StbE
MQAARALQRMPRNTAHIIRTKMAQIAADPHAPHPNASRLRGRPGFRLRVGDWRVIYAIYDDELMIMVMKIAPRGEVYR